MTIEEAIEKIHAEACMYPDRSAQFMADFAEAVINRIGNSSDDADGGVRR